MDFLDALGHLADIVCRHLFSEFAPRTVLECQIELSLGGVLQYQVDGELIFKVIVQFDDVVVVERIHDLYFCFGVFDQFGVVQSALLDLLNGIDILAFLMDGAMHNPERSLPQFLHKVEIEPVRLFLPPSLHTRRQEQYPIAQL